MPSSQLDLDALNVAPLDASKVAPLAALLARSFDRDAAYRYLFADEASRTRGLQDFFVRNLQTHLPHGCTHVATDGAGVLLATVTLRPPAGIPISTLTMIRRGLLPFAFAHGRAAVKRLFWLKATYDAIEARAAQSAPHWHVHMMAVRGDAQGQGVGSALLRRVLEQATATSQHAVVLTTHLPENVVFYRRAGFEVVDEQTLTPPDDRAYSVWSMRRSGA